MGSRLAGMYVDLGPLHYRHITNIPSPFCHPSHCSIVNLRQIGTVGKKTTVVQHEEDVGALTVSDGGMRASRVS